MVREKPVIFRENRNITGFLYLDKIESKKVNF